MAKIPVTKTVIRDGKPHVQTYWEEDDKNYDHPSLLAGLGVSLPPQPKALSFPEDLELENQWRVIMGDQFDSLDAQAAIAAGLTFAAAQCMKSLLPEWVSLSDHIYENGLDELPRPKGGWKNKDGHTSTDQRHSWTVMENIPVEEAVKWIDAGFDRPSVVAALLRENIPFERAKAWADEMAVSRGIRGDAGLPHAFSELRSSMSLEDVRQWRAEFGKMGYDFLDHREISFYDKKFPLSQAKRWNDVCYEDVEVDHMIALREMKWSPSTVKSALKGLPHKNRKLSRQSAELLIEETPRVGNPKLLLEWLNVARIKEYDGHFSPELIQNIHEVERFKERASKEYGISFNSENNYELSQLLPVQRDVLLDIMDSNERFLATGEKSVRKTAELASYISSPDNLAVLRENGFVFSNPDTNLPYDISFGSDDYRDFDARTADKHSRDKWMKELAFRLYSSSVRQQNQRDRWTEDDSIDPVKLKDILLADSKADDVRIEALLVANVAQPVVSGWL